MKNRILSFLLAAVILILPFGGVACAPGIQPSGTAPVDLTRNRVPDLPLDLFLLLQQDGATSLPADLLGLPVDVEVTSVQMWGVAVLGDFAVAGAVELPSPEAALGALSLAPEADDTWIMAEDGTVYFVQGRGAAARTVREAIESGRFKQYDDAWAQAALGFFPNGEDTRLGGIAVLRPGEELYRLALAGATEDAVNLAGTVHGLAQLEGVVAGLYSAERLDVAALAGALENGRDMGGKDIGVLIMASSGLPDFMVSLGISLLAGRAGLAECTFKGRTAYCGALEVDGGNLHVLAILEGSRLFAAVATSEAYAEKLIGSIQKR